MGVSTKKYKLITEHFIIYYHDAEKKCIPEVQELLESRYKIVTKRLSNYLSQKVVVKICSNNKELNSELGLENGPDWIRGGIGKDGSTVIASPLNPPPGSKFDNVLNTVVHEFVHVIINTINPETPRWLNEGIASYEGKDNNEEWIKKSIKEGFECNNVPTLNELDTGEDFQKFFENRGYQFSYSVIQFIVEKYGYETLMKLVKKPHELTEIFNMNQARFRESWLTFLKEKYLDNEN